MTHISKTTRRTIYYDRPTAIQTDGAEPIFGVISQECVDDTLEELNDDSPEWQYGDGQTHMALWNFLNDEIDKLMIDLGDKFLELPAALRERYLGEPEINVREEQRLEAADRAYDRFCGT